MINSESPYKLSVENKWTKKSWSKKSSNRIVRWYANRNREGIKLYGFFNICIEEEKIECWEIIRYNAESARFLDFAIEFLHFNSHELLRCCSFSASLEKMNTGICNVDFISVRKNGDVNLYCVSRPFYPGRSGRKGKLNSLTVTKWIEKITVFNKYDEKTTTKKLRGKNNTVTTIELFKNLKF